MIKREIQPNTIYEFESKDVTYQLDKRRLDKTNVSSWVIKYKLNHSNHHISVRGRYNTEFHTYINSKMIGVYMDAWGAFLSQCLDRHRVNRLLIIGAGHQLISNYIYDNYPCDILQLDVNQDVWLDPEMREIFETYRYLNGIDPIDDLQRKFVSVDVPLKEAYEDGMLQHSTFDLVLVEGYYDDFSWHTGIYTPETAEILYRLVKPEKYVIIHEGFLFRKTTQIELSKLTMQEIADLRVHNSKYRAYHDAMNGLFCMTDRDFVFARHLMMYAKVPVNIIEDEKICLTSLRY